MNVLQEICACKELNGVRNAGDTKRGEGLCREALFWRLVACGNEMTLMSKAMAFNLLDDTRKRSRKRLIEEVWDFCVANGVLSPDRGGYSSKAWLSRLSNSHQSTAKPELIDPNPPRLQSGDVIYVRDNVALTRDELERLKSDHPDDYEDRIDLLSKWKLKKGGNFEANDASMLNGWVSRSFASKRNSGKVTKQDSGTAPDTSKEVSATYDKIFEESKAYF